MECVVPFSYLNPFTNKEAICTLTFHVFMRITLVSLGMVTCVATAMATVLL